MLAITARAGIICSVKWSIIVCSRKRARSTHTMNACFSIMHFQEKDAVRADYCEMCGKKRWMAYYAECGKQSRCVTSGRWLQTNTHTHPLPPPLPDTNIITAQMTMAKDITSRISSFPSLISSVAPTTSWWILSISVSCQMRRGEVNINPWDVHSVTSLLRL